MRRKADFINLWSIAWEQADRQRVGTCSRCARRASGARQQFVGAGHQPWHSQFEARPFRCLFRVALAPRQLGCRLFGSSLPATTSVLQRSEVCPSCLAGNSAVTSCSHSAEDIDSPDSLWSHTSALFDSATTTVCCNVLRRLLLLLCSKL